MNNQFIKLNVLVVFFGIFLTAVVLATTAQYTYDNLNRLIKVQYDDGTIIQYTYDEVGNRLTQQVQAFSEAAAKSASGGTPVSAPAPVPSTPESLVVTGAGAFMFPAWPTLLTRIRLAASTGELEDLQGDIQNFLDQGAFSPEEKDRYQKELAQELEARADFIRRTTAARGERAGAENLGVTPGSKDAAAGPRHNKIQKDKEKIYTPDPEPGLEKAKP